MYVQKRGSSLMDNYVEHCNDFQYYLANAARVTFVVLSVIADKFNFE
jgi:hypothetical protein